MTVELRDWLNSINHTKENIIDIDPDLEKDYPPYIINKCLWICRYYSFLK